MEINTTSSDGTMQYFALRALTIFFTPDRKCIMRFSSSTYIMRFSSSTYTCDNVGEEFYNAVLFKYNEYKKSVGVEDSTFRPPGSYRNASMVAESNSDHTTITLLTLTYGAYCGNTAITTIQPNMTFTKKWIWHIFRRDWSSSSRTQII